MTTISVTNQDIENGIANSCIHCPIALAVNRKLKFKYKGAVKVKEILIYDESDSSLECTEARITLPPVASKFVIDFDRWVEEVKPFSFELDIPVEYLL